MRKTITAIGIIAIQLYSAQSTSVDFFKPVPTVSYLSTYIDTPVDISTGVPKVDLPVFSLPTRNKHVNINIDLSYHSKNAIRFQKSSDVGLGWSLLNVNNVISKTTIGGPDERSANNPLMNMDVFQFNDVYYFNAFGMSGKFVFRKIDNQIKVQNLGTSKEKIEFTNSTSKYFDIKDFKITDEYGNQYFFNKSVEVIEDYFDYIHKGAYYLTKVLDAQDQEIVSIEYTEYPYTEQSIQFMDYKPKRIISKGYGEINLEYEYLPHLRYKSNTTNLSDCYRIKKAELKDTENRLVQKFDLEQGGLSYYKYDASSGHNVAYETTTLSKISRKNSQGGEIESYSFAYNSTGTEKNYGATANFGFDVCPTEPEPIREWTDNPKYSTIGTLSKMILPTKGYVKFNFESSQYYYDRTLPVNADPLNPTGSYPEFHIGDKEVQYFKPITSANFNTQIKDTYTFNVTSNGTPQDYRDLVLCFAVNSYNYNPLLDPNTSPNITIFLDGGAIMQTADGYGRIYAPYVTAGQHTITISGNTTGTGYFSVSELHYADVTSKNYKSKYGSRIQSIEYFDSETSAIPSKTKTYSYEKFSDATSSSGNLSPFISFNKSSDFITMYGDKEFNKNIIYKNVKETDSDGGYTKYTFIGLDDMNPAGANSPMTYLEDSNNRGVLIKKESFSSGNQRLTVEDHEYTYQNREDIYPIMIEQHAGYTTLNPVFIKKHKIINTSLFAQNKSVTTTRETVTSKDDFNVEYSSESTGDGNVYETYYTYPFSKQITKLLSKNIYKDIIETKNVLNGKVLSRTEAKYDNPGHLFPTSVLSQDTESTSMSSELTFDQYDSKGNLVQYTTKNNNPVTIIWGYNQTYPVAKIEGARLSDIPQSLIDSIVNASNTDASAVPNSDENSFLSVLNTFRNSLSSYQVTTYTYDPVIGVRSITPSSGIREVYIYDSANRLKEVRENNVTGNLLKEFNYNYKN